MVICQEAKYLDRFRWFLQITYLAGSFPRLAPAQDAHGNLGVLVFFCVGAYTCELEHMCRLLLPSSVFFLLVWQLLLLQEIQGLVQELALSSQVCSRLSGARGVRESNDRSIHLVCERLVVHLNKFPCICWI
jgi:hypothetical protein